jgi:hypothetical protein
MRNLDDEVLAPYCPQGTAERWVLSTTYCGVDERRTPRAMADVEPKVRKRGKLRNAGPVGGIRGTSNCWC